MKNQYFELDRKNIFKKMFDTFDTNLETVIYVTIR
jgi:hypothetical protein